MLCSTGACLQASAENNPNKIAFLRKQQQYINSTINRKSNYDHTNVLFFKQHSLSLYINM